MSDDTRAPDGTAAPAAAHAGTCAIVGLPNVGKSTLLNRILGRHLVAVSPRPQTTRNRILGIHRTEVAGLEPPQVELCFVDTPGIQRGKGALRRFMRDQALGAVTDSDVTLLVIDASDRRGREPARLAEPDAAELAVAAGGQAVIVALNKIDRVAKPDLLPLIDAWHRWGADRRPDDPSEVVPIAGKTGDGVERLVAVIAARLPVGPLAFPADMVTDRAEAFLAAELVREQLYHQLGQELPYAAGVVVESFEERDRGDLAIGAAIVVERESQKAIVIGRGGARIKEIGIAARQALAELFGCPVHLSLFVKIVPDWTQGDAGLRRLGYGAES
ncbi:MAG TPA: GTPase Era [Kofleriaceae bacterium]|nr:GTPase Era [Kofleriaceae bacterium]